MAGPGPGGGDGVFDPVAEAAAVAWREAPGLCGVDPVSGVRCDWYHGLWLYTRLFGLNNTLSRHAGLYLDALAPLARDGDHSRVLVSGAADYLLPALPIAAYGRAGADLALTVNDRCETPLRLSRWYGQRIDVALETRRQSLLDGAVLGEHDVVCAHSLLNFVDPEQWPALFRAWHRILRPGGRLLLANAIRPDAPPGLSGFDADRAASLGRRIRDAAATQPASVMPPAAAFDRAVDAYLRHFMIYPTRSRADLLGLFEDAGFAIDDARFGNIGRAPSEIPEHSPGGVDEKREYGWFVATRR